jgi:acylphosphatase
MKQAGFWRVSGDIEGMSPEVKIFRVRAHIRGRVQGVSFRAYTSQQAARRGVSGWVKNEPDGSVLLEAQGTPEAVEALLTWCTHGPPGARVTGVESEPIDPHPAETSFRIRF